MTAGAFSVVVCRIIRRVAGGMTQALPSLEAQFGSVACTRTPADCGTQASERPDTPLRLNHSLPVSGGEETKHIGAGDVSRPRLYFSDSDSRGP